ncbi:MAG: ABC transporter substrate-binding protein [Sulfurovum sp.]|nr:ABC transporter substrate-binding protein [Sulfurovum sp.]
MLNKYYLVLVMLFSAIGLNAVEKLDKLIIAGPAASISHPMFKIIESDALKDIAGNVEFKLWRTPDQLKAMIINKSVDFIAVPTNVAAVFYNKKQPIQLLNVSIWGLMSVISRDKSIKNIKDLKGKEMIVPFRNDVPDITLSALLKKEGIEPGKDMKIHYTPNIVDALQLLVAKTADTALMLEPIASMALIKDKSLQRSMDIQKEWGKIFNTEPKLPQAGIVAVGDMTKNQKVIDRFLEEYTKAIKWYKSNPAEAGELAAKNLKMLNKKAVASSIPFVRFESVPIAKAKKELQFYFDLLHKNNPKTVGGKLPDDSFYDIK